MKNLFRLMTLVLIIISASCASRHDGESISLNSGWKFKTGDDPAYAGITFNDSSWSAIDPATIWESQGFEGHNGYGWYRTRVTIPSTLKAAGPYSDSIQFSLGKIDDCDQVYLNGVLIGENTRTIQSKADSGGDFTKKLGVWNVERRYVLSSKDPRILWDQENVLAIRCFDQGGAGGMFGKPFEITVPGLKDYVRLEPSGTPFILQGDTTVVRKFSIINKSSQKEFQGLLKIRAEDNRGISLYDEQYGILLSPGMVLEKVTTFKWCYRTPARLTITFTESATGASLSTTEAIPYIQTPSEKPVPSINGARVFGVRPYSPFLFKVPATGTPPLRYSATNLPEGLAIDSASGIITGLVKKKGEYIVTLRVDNEIGNAQRDLKIVVGDLISLTPPMGWNSWNCWGLSVSDRKVRQSANAMKTSGLIDHGWTYINIDDGWQDTHDRDGNILPNGKFPDMKSLCNHVHNLGLKIGIYSSPGPLTCGGYTGSYTFEEKDARNYAAWGFDYLKYDWCSYYQIAPKPTLDEMKLPYRVMKHAIRRVNRDIHYSLCQYGMGKVWEWGAEVDGNSWRTTTDIEDTWESMSSIGFSQIEEAPFATPGRWNDPDMLVVGWVGWGPALHYTRLTPDEQYTHMTLWSLLASPLLIGCDLEQLDPFTLNLLTNDEVIAVNQDPLGKQAALIRKGAGYEIWAREVEDGSVVAGLFNRSEKALSVPVDLKDLGVEGKKILRDLWKQQDLGVVYQHFEMNVPPHGAKMVMISKRK